MSDLASAKLFKGLPEKELQQIAKSFTEVVHPAGKKVMASGTEGVGFMVVLEGELEVVLADGHKHIIREGDHFGEMALLDRHGRSGDVTALTRVTVLALAGWDFKAFLASHPEVAYRLLQTLSERVRGEESE